MVHVKLQSSPTDESLKEIIESVYEDDGITGFWRGFKAASILVINPAIVFLIFERMQKAMFKQFGNSQESIINFFVGGLSKALAGVVTYPLVKIKMMLQVLLHFVFGCVFMCVCVCVCLLFTGGKHKNSAK